MGQQGYTEKKVSSEVSMASSESCFDAFDCSIEKVLHFTDEHRDEDPLRLLLQQSKYPDIDLRLVAQQLEGLRQASAKWPTLASCATYLYPPKINREQSSSEFTAKYKSEIFERLGGGTFADLTGGMGIDTFFLSLKAQAGDYFEIDEGLCALARHNFSALGQASIATAERLNECFRDRSRAVPPTGNISVHHGDSMAAIAQGGDRHYDFILIDPARRDIQGRKVAAFEDCTPNLLAHRDALLRSCRTLMVKASPMIDIDMAVQQLGAVDEVHVVAVGGECKEVLFLLSNAAKECGNPEPPSNLPIFKSPHLQIVDLQKGFKPISFTREEESAALPQFAASVGRYLYEPNAAVMKGGCYNSICAWFGVEKLARNTHLYTSSAYQEAFPGRCFEVLQPLSLNAKDVAKAIPEKKAHVATRNFPLSAAELQKKLKLREGGTLFVIAATHASYPIGLLCRQCY